MDSDGRGGGDVLLEDDRDSGRKVKVEKNNCVDSGVGGEGRRTSAGMVSAGRLC